MINNKYLKLLRSQHRFEENNFIYKIIAKRIIDSIDLIKIKLNNVLEIGINEDQTYNYILNKFLKSKIDRADLCESKSKKNYNFIELDIDNFRLNDDYYDLIYSNCFLNLTNNFEKNLNIIYRSLKSNGFFIAAIPSKFNMFQLLNTMYETDIHFYKGAYQRFNPTIEIDNILPSLQKSNFDIPSIYSDSISIGYSSFQKLLEDIKKMNISYSCIDKKNNFENKNYFKVLENFYKKKYFNEDFELEINVNILSGWKK